MHKVIKEWSNNRNYIAVTEFIYKNLLKYSVKLDGLTLHTDPSKDFVMKLFNILKNGYK